MTLVHGRDLAGEKRRDAEQVERIYAQMGMESVSGLYGPMPYAFGPDDRIEDEEGYVQALLAHPDVGDSTDAEQVGDGGRPAPHQPLRGCL